MDVSKNDTPSGQQLIQTVVSLTGLPIPWVRAEIDKIIQTSGFNASDLTLNEFRAAMMLYLESLNQSNELGAEAEPDLIPPSTHKLAIVRK